jgi:DNA-binding transcriptional MocR family regulator
MESGLLEAADVEQFTLHCVANGRAEMVARQIETLIASMETAPTDSLFSVVAVEAIITLADSTLLHRLQAVIERRAVAARNQSDHQALKALLENLRKIQQLGTRKNLAEKEAMKVFCARLSSRVWDVYVSEMCVDPAYGWKDMTSNHVEQLFQVTTTHCYWQLCLVNSLPFHIDSGVDGIRRLL